MNAGSVELQLAWRLMHLLERDSATIGREAGERMAKTAQSLISGKTKLPFQHICALPRATLCPGGCTEVYCSSRCCAEAWQRHHCLLCRGSVEMSTGMHLRNVKACPYVREFEPEALQKFQHDRERFGWIVQRLPPLVRCPAVRLACRAPRHDERPVLACAMLRRPQQECCNRSCAPAQLVAQGDSITSPPLLRPSAGCVAGASPRHAACCRAGARADEPGPVCQSAANANADANATIRTARAGAVTVAGIGARQPSRRHHAAAHVFMPRA